MAGQPIPAAEGDGRGKPRRASRGTLGWLIGLYLVSPEFTAFKEITRKARRPLLAKLQEDKGTIDIEDVTKAVIQDSLNARRETPHMANVWLTTVSNLFDWACSEMLPDPMTGVMKPILLESPCVRVKRLAIPRPSDPDEEAGHPTFSDEDLAKFEKSYPLGTRERLVYSVLLFTGFRVGDAARFGRQHVKERRDGTMIELRTEKGRGAAIAIEAVAPLKRALAAGPHGRVEVLNFLTTPTGKPWAKAHLSGWFGDACRAIGLDRSAHGLRKAAARRFAERGVTVNQLMALFGWRDVRVAMHYVEAANRRRMALDAQRAVNWEEQIEAESEPASSPTPLLGGGTSA
jgi:integrase